MPHRSGSADPELEREHSPERLALDVHPFVPECVDEVDDRVDLQVNARLVVVRLLVGVAVVQRVDRDRVEPWAARFFMLRANVSAWPPMPWMSSSGSHLHRRR